MSLGESQVKNLTPVKLFPGKDTPFTSLAHNPQGTFFITTSPAGSLQLYDALRGRHSKTIYSKKYGCSNGTFLLKASQQSTPSSCVIASTIPASNNNKANNALRFLDLNTNSFIRYFTAHTAQVTSVVSSTSTYYGFDTFYSASRDGTIRVWDSRTETPNSTLAGMGRNPVISIDPSGSIMAIWNGSKRVVNLVQVDYFPNGLISSIPVDVNGDVECMKWAGNLLIVDVPGRDKIVIDTLQHSVVSRLVGVTEFVTDTDDVVRSGSLDITPDSKWCFGGSGDASILAWSLHDLSPKQRPIIIDSLVDKQAIPRIVVHNPKLACLVTADTEIVLNLYS